MARNRKRRINPRREAAAADPVPQSAARNHFLDALRGLAILLMVLDHVVGIVMEIPIHGSAVRTATRLAMPLFCVLMGYFLRPERRWQWRRPLQILAAAVVANLLFWPYYQRIEILGSLLVAYGLFMATGRFFPWCVLAILAYPVDPLRPWFDFPPLLTVSFVAQGALLRRWGYIAAIGSGIFLSSGALWIEQLEPAGVNQKLCLFLLPATLLVILGEGWPKVRIALLETLGRYPLSAYLAQYYVIFPLAWWLRRG